MSSMPGIIELRQLGFEPVYSRRCVCQDRVSRRTGGAQSQGLSRRMDRSVDRGRDRRPRRLWQRAPVAVPERIRNTGARQGLRGLQRQYVAPDLVQSGLRPGGVSRTDGGGAVRAGRRRLRSGLVPARCDRHAAGWRDGHERCRDPCTGRSSRAPGRRDADAARGLARHAIRL